MKRQWIECIEDVIMKDDGTKAFTKGEKYRTYLYWQKDLWDIYPVICVKNDQKERHTIKHVNDDKDDDFYYKHFKEVKANEKN